MFSCEDEIERGNVAGGTRPADPHHRLLLGKSSVISSSNFVLINLQFGFGAWGTVVEFDRAQIRNSTMPWPLPVNETTSVTRNATSRAF